MPVVNCYTSNANLLPDQWDRLVQVWAKKIGVDKGDINIPVISDFLQVGETYDLKVELYLPSLWPEQDVSSIQQSFLVLAEEILNIKQKTSF